MKGAAMKSMLHPTQDYERSVSGKHSYCGRCGETVTSTTRTGFGSYECGPCLGHKPLTLETFDLTGQDLTGLPRCND